VTEYFPRVTDAELDERLGYIGAVLIEGPKACGKTETATRHASTVIHVDDDDERALLQLVPSEFLAQPKPILLDEWQLEPGVWDRVRREVDKSRGKGLFILTGSATPKDNAARHSGAGRFSVLPMRPMSLFESGHSTGEVSLAALLRGEAQPTRGGRLDLRGVVTRIVVGGWPSLIDADERMAQLWLQDYLSNLVEVDVPAIDTRRDPEGLRRTLSALARNVAQPVTSAELARDVGGEAGPIAAETLAAYLRALRRLHLLDDSPAWLPHMRSRTRLRRAPVRYFVDPSLGLAALGVGSGELLADPKALGYHFEALAARDLRIYAQTQRGRVESWRDANGKEVDAVVTLDDRRWGAFEIKLSPAAVDAAAANLTAFSERVDSAVHGRPSCLGVITATGPGGRRPDGVDVIPLTALRP